MTAEQTRIRSLDDPEILVQTPATIYDAIPPLPPGRWTSVLDGTASSGGVKLADLLARFPVALLLHG